MTLPNGKSSVPQQFFETQHTKDTLEAIILKIDTPEGFIVFVGERNLELFLQVGIIGCENYPKSNDSNFVRFEHAQRKIVYGRRWLIERTSPTSEVIQTACLAIKKARERELSGKVFVTASDGATATPFNCHIDLPLMAANREFLAASKIKSMISKSN